jgi:hypothetical protein
MGDGDGSALGAAVVKTPEPVMAPDPTYGVLAASAHHDRKIVLTETPEEFSRDGVQLLRNTQMIQVSLSQMADEKAGILLGITFVIFTIAVGQSSKGPPPLAVTILGAAAFVAAILAVMAVLPMFGRTKTMPKHGNILFFGHFSAMSEDAYVDLMMNTITDTRTIYESFCRDIYQNGQVLAGKKYRMLGFAYRVLLVGLVSSAAAFVIPLVAKVLGLPAPWV